MNVGAKFEKVEEMEMTVVITGSVAEFTRLLEHLKEPYLHPMDKLAAAIRAQVRKATIQVSTETIES